MLYQKGLNAGRLPLSFDVTICDLKSCFVLVEISLKKLMFKIDLIYHNPHLFLPSPFLNVKVPH